MRLQPLAPRWMGVHQLCPVDVSARPFHSHEHRVLLRPQLHRGVRRTPDEWLDGQRRHRLAGQIGAVQPAHLRTADGDAAIDCLVAGVAVQNAAFARKDAAGQAGGRCDDAVRGLLEWRTGLSWLCTDTFRISCGG